MKKIVFVLNPHSGKALIKNALLKIIQVFSEAGYDVTVYPTKAPLDGYEYLKKREGQYDVLVCSGGDGTLNEVDYVPYWNIRQINRRLVIFQAAVPMILQPA